jgi:hypothetical protein
MTLDLFTIREQFPALHRPAIFFDNPGGTQIAQKSIDRIASYLTLHNANHGGAFATSIESDAVLEEAHLAMADLERGAVRRDRFRQQYDQPDPAHQPLDRPHLECRRRDRGHTAGS